MPSFSMRIRPSLLRSCMLLLLGACGGGDDPIVPSVGTATGALAAAGAVGSAIGSVPAVRITDAKGRVATGVLVRWRVTSGGGRVLNDTARTGPTGDASSGGWTLGTAAGTQTLTATADGVPTVTFTAEAAAGPAARMTVTAGGTQHATVASSVATPPSVRVEDQYGNPVAGRTVTFTIATGDGTLQGAQGTSNAQGLVTLGGWRLGTRSGEQLLRASIPGLPDVNFLAIADPGPAVSFAAAPGSVALQDGVVGETAPIPLVVRLVDEYGNGASGSSVTFTPASGSGTVSLGTVTPNADGLASVSWQLGAAESQSVTATTGAMPGTSVVFRATAHPSAFRIDVRFVGDGGSDVQRAAFRRAAVRWRRVLSARLHTTRLLAPAGDCDSWIPALDETIPDLLVYVRLRGIDGPGGVLAQAGPCYVNAASALPAMGLMEFDTSDMEGLSARGTLEETVVHELGHVLGIGTLWSYRRALLTGAGSADPYYVGDAGRAQFGLIGGLSYTGTPVPVENTGGDGTRDAHWRLSIFGNELMQGYEGTPPAPLSTVTAASLTDLGYPGVLLSGADGFRIGPAAFFESPAARVPRTRDVKRLPLTEVAPDGTRRRIRSN